MIDKSSGLHCQARNLCFAYLLYSTPHFQLDFAFIRHMLYNKCVILEHDFTLTVPQIRASIERISAVLGTTYFSGDEIIRYAELMQVYSGAMREVSTKLENLDEEFHVRNFHNPIHHMECRLKSIESTIDKLKRKHLPVNCDSVEYELTDIAGIRVICNYIDDVYNVAQTLAAQSDITVLRTKDYIAKPKPNGYRSLHLIVQVPVFLSTGPRLTAVEVQLRTIAMDYWASLEHRLRYKNDIAESRKLAHAQELLDCAHNLADIEQRMQHIHQDLG